MEFQVTSTSYCIEVTVDQFRKIIDRENEQQNDGDWENGLNNQLEEIEGVEDVDYNGHFGANIFFRMTAEVDERETKFAIKKVIDSWIS